MVFHLFIYAKVQVVCVHIHLGNDLDTGSSLNIVVTQGV